MRFDDDTIQESLRWFFGVDDEEADEEDHFGPPVGGSGDPDPEGSDEEMGLELLEDDGSYEGDNPPEGVVIETEYRDEGQYLDSLISDSVPERNARIDAYDGDAGHEEIRQYLRETGLIEAVAEALEEVSTIEMDATAERGSVLDMRNVTRLLAGDSTIRDYYRRREQHPADDIAVGISLDMSGSMSRVELEAKAAVGAFLFGVQELGGEVVANAWHSPRGEDVAVRLLTHAGEPFAWRHLDAVEPDGQDPISRGMLECAAMLERTTASEKLLVVVTDGRPTVRSHPEKRYDSTLTEAAETVSELRTRGLTVVGFGFGGVHEDNLDEMFGHDVDDKRLGYHHVDLPGLPASLVEEYGQHVGHGTRV